MGGTATQGPGPHRTAALLSIGDELTLGQTLDTNSMWLADRLAMAGVRTVEHVTVDDDEARIALAMERLAAEADLLVISGGLGPTADDLTRFALARVLRGGPGAGRGDLEEDAEAAATLRAWFAGRPGGMPAANIVQALRPAGAVFLKNANGTAPGLFARVERLGCDVFCLPGPPREMKPMFEAEIVPRLRGEPGRVPGVRLVLTIGLGESAVAERLGELMDRDRPARGLPLVGTTASRGVVTCRVRHEAADDASLTAALDEVERDIARRIGPAVFDRRDPARGDAIDVTDALPRRVLALLRDRGATLAVAESCTGGLLGEILTDVPGSSDVFLGGWITYANEAKARELGVEAAVIERHGAVSGEVAAAMARGAVSRSGASFAVAVTGVAGPGGGTEAKPVGTVWVAVAGPEGRMADGRIATGHLAGGDVDVRRFRFKGDRGAIREWSARSALAMLRLRLERVRMPLLGEVAAG